MDKRMRYLTALLLGFWFLGLLQACKKENDVDPGFGPNGEPRILAVQIPDIPPQNITINQDTKQIQITVPTSFSARFAYPALTLTPGTTAAQDQPNFSTYWKIAIDTCFLSERVIRRRMRTRMY